MTPFEHYSLVLDGVITLCIVLTVVYSARQFRRSANMHQANLEWHKRIATRDQLNEYSNKSNSINFLNEKFQYIGNRHPISIEIIKQELQKDKDTRIHLRHLLNYYESLAIGIHSEIYNEQLIKSSRKTVMIDIYTSFKEYIQYIRSEKRSDSLYRCFEELITKWLKEDNDQKTLPNLGSV